MGSSSAVRQPRELRLSVNGLEIALFEWQGEGRPVFFAHATGFHARCWDQVIARLPGRHCLAVDLRGHGRSDKPPAATGYSWQAISTDVAELLRSLEVQNALAVGHSGGGYAVTVAATMAIGAIGGLLLVDPAIGARDRFGRGGQGANSFAAKRRNAWASPDEMFERFHDRHPYRLWRPEALRDYCEYGLLPDPAGEGFVLACPPEIEAAVYANATAHDPYDAIHAVDLPVRVLRARQRQAGEAANGMVDMSASPTAPDLATHFPRGEDVSLPQLSHFIPMEAPDLVAQHVMELLDA